MYIYMRVCHCFPLVCTTFRQGLTYHFQIPLVSSWLHIVNVSVETWLSVLIENGYRRMFMLSLINLEVKRSSLFITYF